MSKSNWKVLFFHVNYSNNFSKKEINAVTPAEIFHGDQRPSGDANNDVAADGNFSNFRKAQTEIVILSNFYMCVKVSNFGMVWKYSKFSNFSRKFGKNSWKIKIIVWEV